MNGWEAFGIYALILLAFIGLLALGYCAFIGARQMDREREAGREKLKEKDELERYANEHLEFQKGRQL